MQFNSQQPGTISLYRRMDFRRPEPFSCVHKELDLPGNWFSSSDNHLHHCPELQRHQHFVSPASWSWLPWGISGPPCRKESNFFLVVLCLEPHHWLWYFVWHLTLDYLSFPGFTFPLFCQSSLGSFLISHFHKNLYLRICSWKCQPETAGIKNDPTETQDKILELVDSLARWR